MYQIVKNLSVLLFLKYICNKSFLYILLTIPYGYIIYGSSFIFITQKSRFLQGSSFNNNKLISQKFYILSKILFLLIFLKIIIFIISNKISNKLFIKVVSLYFCIYLDGGEYKGNYRLSDNSFIKKIYFYFFSCKKNKIYMLDKDNIESSHNQYILALHPHGLIPLASGINLSASPEIYEIYKKYFLSFLNNLYAGTATFNYFFPILRELYLTLGTVDCSRPILTKYLNDKKSLAIFIGGARESLFCGKGSTKILLKKRDGFIKLALETGSSIIPVFTFVENI